MQVFATMCSTVLGLHYPVEFSLKDVDLDGVEVDGVYLGYCEENLFHTIIVSPNAGRGVFEVIAHEFAHAYCAEQHPGAKDHGYTFRRVAARLRADLRNLGFKIGPLFLKGVDK